MRGYPPTYARGPHGDCDFSFLELFTLLYRLESRLSFTYPQLVLRVGEDADVGLREGFRRGHRGSWWSRRLSMGSEVRRGGIAGSKKMLRAVTGRVIYTIEG